MSDRTEIAWTDATWNPAVGCTRVSAGCEHCYAEKMARRIAMMGEPGSPSWRRYAPLVDNLWYADSTKWRWSGKVELFPERLDQPLRWRKPRRIFVCSMSDLFHESVPEEYIDRVFAVMAFCSRHQFQVLTKRPERMQEYMTGLGRSFDRLKAAMLEGYALEWQGISLVRWPIPNIWLGVTTENQKALDERVPHLLQTPAAVRFVSAEPLLGPLDFWRCGSLGPAMGDPIAFSALTGTDDCDPPIPGIDWCIVGGESGPRARPCSVEWIRSVVWQCREAGVSCFVKQLGSHHARHATRCSGSRTDFKGADPSEWPEDLRVQEYPR